jgi:hypothetical protein
MLERRPKFKAFLKNYVFLEFFSGWMVMNERFQRKYYLLSVKQTFLVTAGKKTCENLLYIRIRATYHVGTCRVLRGEHNLF